MTLDEYCLSLGINVSASLVYDALKSLFRKRANPTFEECRTQISTLISIEKAQVHSEKIIEFLAGNGDIEISKCNVFARAEILMQSSNLAMIQIKEGSSVSTNSTSINLGANSSIKVWGGASIHQSENGIFFSA